MISKKTLITAIILGTTTPNFLFGSDIENIMNEAKTSVKSINTKELNDLLKKDPNIQIIDVRTREDINKQGGYLKVNNYTNIPRDKLEFLISQNAQKDEEFIVYCNNGDISLLAANTLKNMGYKKVIWYKDSFKGWKNSNNKINSLDRYKGSMLYSRVKEVSKGVYTSIGITAPYWYESTAHNNNLGFVIGDDSVLVWNASSSYLLAQSLHKEIKKITNKPVKFVLLENSQGHAMLGSNYWKEQGAKIIAHELTKDEIKNKGDRIHARMSQVLQDRFEGTKVVMPDEYFSENMSFDLGGRVVEAKYFGYAHEHSDIALWLPKEKILFAGDLAFNDRLLPIFEITETDKWLEAWEKLEELDAKIVIPGHGDVTNMDTVRKYTKDYLVYLRSEIEKILDDDGGLNDAYNIDMSAYQHLDTYKELGKQNIARTFKRMEFE